jgi:hypothetical protein
MYLIIYVKAVAAAYNFIYLFIFFEQIKVNQPLMWKKVVMTRICRAIQCAALTDEKQEKNHSTARILPAYCLPLCTFEHEGNLLVLISSPTPSGLLGLDHMP